MIPITIISVIVLALIILYACVAISADSDRKQDESREVLERYLGRLDEIKPFISDADNCYLITEKILKEALDDVTHYEMNNRDYFELYEAVAAVRKEYEVDDDAE